MDYEVEISEGQFLDLQSNKGAVNYPLPSASGLQKNDTVSFYEVDGANLRTGNFGRGIVRFANNDFFAVLPTGQTWYFLSPLNMLTWQNISDSCSYVGWSSYTTKKVVACKMGSVLIIRYIINGTSNSTSTSITIPYKSANDGTVNRGVCRVTNNGAVSTDLGLVTLSPNASQIDIYRNQNSLPWTASGNKVVSGTIIISLPNP